MGGGRWKKDLERCSVERATNYRMPNLKNKNTVCAIIKTSEVARIDQVMLLKEIPIRYKQNTFLIFASQYC